MIFAHLVDLKVINDNQGGRPNFGCATICALPSFGDVMTFSSHATLLSHKVSVKCSDIDMCSAIYFLFDHNMKYGTIYLCPHTVVATV